LYISRIVSIALARIKQTPLRSRGWLVWLVGLAQLLLVRFARFVGIRTIPNR